MNIYITYCKKNRKQILLKVILLLKIYYKKELQIFNFTKIEVHELFELR